MTTVVTRNDDAGRYEIAVDGELAGFLTFRVDGEVITFVHTEVFSEFEGQGLASTLIRQALDATRARSLRVIPKCPFVRDFIESHAEYQDLLAE